MKRSAQLGPNLRTECKYFFLMHVHSYKEIILVDLISYISYISLLHNDFSLILWRERPESQTGL